LGDVERLIGVGQPAGGEPVDGIAVQPYQLPECRAVSPPRLFN
jgi:hypothetical protein